MRALVHRLGMACLVVGGVVCGAIACGGAPTSDLEDPAGTVTPEPDGSPKARVPDATTDAPGEPDATTRDDATDPAVDASSSLGDEGDDASDLGLDAGTDGPAGSLCGPCTLGTRCCETRGALSYGQCYSLVCPLCCPP
jgi:hypothetical protein